MMRFRKKLAAVAVAGGILVGGVALAAPAGATVVNVSCPTNGVTVYSYPNGEADYCYVLQRDGNTSPGWADIPDTYQVGSGVNTGYVEDPYGWIPVHFAPGTVNVPGAGCGSGCLWTTRWVYITN